MKMRTGPAKTADDDLAQGVECVWLTKEAVVREAEGDDAESDLEPPKESDGMGGDAAPGGELAAAAGDREELIREIAYQRYHLCDYAPGYALDEWLAAKAEVDLRFTPEP